MRTRGDYKGRTSLSFVLVHVAPPSAERYRPEGRFCAGLVLSTVGLGAVSASTRAYTTFASLGAIARPMRPFIVSGNPPPFTSVHVLPPSLVFHRALPGPPLFRSKARAPAPSPRPPALRGWWG